METTSPIEIDYLLEEKKRLETGGKLHWFHWLIVLSSLLLTFGAWYFAKTQVEAQVKNQFEREAERTIELISERMRKYEDALWGGVAAIHSQSHGIDNEEWERYSATLRIESKYPGINGIGIIYYVPKAEKYNFLKEQRTSRPDFKIHPEHEENELFPITYIEPVATNAKAIGLDMAHEINRYTAAKKARETGTAQITGPIILVQDAQKTPGFLFYAPFYNNVSYETTEDRANNFVGLVYAPFIFKKLMLGTLETEKRHVGIKISDDETVLFDENHSGENDFDANPLYKQSTMVTMYGRNWNFEIWSKHSFRTANTNNKPWMILAGGLLIDSLLLGLFVFLARSNRRAINFANRMTEGYQSQAEHLSNVINEAIDGLITIDEHGIIQSFNPACETIFSYKAKEVIGKNVKILMPEPFHGEHDGYLANYHKTGEKKIIGAGREVEGQRKDGHIFPLDLSVSALSSKGKKLYSGIVRDITDRKQAEDELMQSNEELERFAYVASHDLQEPLRMVTSFTGLLEKNYGDKLDNQAKEYIGFAYDGAFRMQALVDDLLEYARISGEAVRYNEVNVNQLMLLVQQNLHDSIESSNAKITHDELPVIRTNPVRFMRLMQNLIGNSLKYQKENEIPEIHVNAKKDGDTWLFSVKDNGIGMKQEYCQKIFEPFKRLHNKNEYSGTGMGLAICRKIVESFGGKLWAESELNKGSIFYFTMPVNTMTSTNEEEE